MVAGQSLAEWMETRPAWWGNDYSPFRVPINAHSRWNLKSNLYFIGALDRPHRMKIGLAVDVTRRLREFAAGDPDITLFARRTICRPLDRQIERLVHEALGDHALGREWFAVTLAEALVVAKPIIAKSRHVVQRMARDGVFGYD